MNREYITEKALTLKQIEDTVDFLDKLYREQSESSIIDRILHAAEVGTSATSLWLTAPTSYNVASIVAALFLNTYNTSKGVTRNLIKHGLDDLKDIEIMMHRNNYSMIKAELGVLEINDNNGQILIIESANPTAARMSGGSGWMIL